MNTNGIRRAVIAAMAAPTLMLGAIPISAAQAHCFVGARFLPATLVTDDPCVADEMSIPTLDWFKTADVPTANQVDISVDFSKRITQDFGVTLSGGWTQIRPLSGGTVAGFQNFGTTFQYQLFKDGSQEFLILLGLGVEWGSTGAVQSGLAEPFSTLTPTITAGKGFGDLPTELGWARPFAVTGQVGYQLPQRSFDAVNNIPIPQNLVYSGSLQYSIPYLTQNVIDLDLPEFFKHLIPIVEAQFTSPVANNFGLPATTIGTINPGAIWVGDYYQVGVEAIVPVNRFSGHGTGVIAQLHLYLDDIFPTTIGQPLLGPRGPAPQLPFGG
jgi:hypothetical protein